MMNAFDFSKIRGETVEAQQRFFEQLVCKLALLDGDRQSFRRIEGSGGDGGVEAVRILPSGNEIGYQAKFFPMRGKIDWGQVDESVTTALQWHPRLERYVIAFPCDFTGRRAARGGSTAGVWGTWDERVKRWEAQAKHRGMTVEFHPWTAFDLEAALRRPNAQHLVPFYFEHTLFTREWMHGQLDRTIHDLRSRYSPGEHVDTESLTAFDVIHRRGTVRADLRAVFDIAQSSNPRAAAALASDDFDWLAVEAERRRDEFVVLADAVEWKPDRSWPLCEWVTRWHAFAQSLWALHDAFRTAARGKAEDRHGDLGDCLATLTRMYDLTRPEVFGGRWSYKLPLDGARAALFVGRAGAGKSHVLARGGEIAWREGAPVIHLLGQHIVDDDPRDSILRRLGLSSWSFHEALSALNLAAEAAGTRALLIIDALNEGRGTDIWFGQISGLVQEVNKHDRIVLVVSCREEYLDFVVPPELIAQPRSSPSELDEAPEDCAPLGKLVEVPVSGFRTIEEREAALQRFMDEKGIARPTAPVLDDEFFNPLFMSSVCRSMAAAKEKVFPRGLHGAREIFGFVLETKAKALGTRHDAKPGVLDSLRDALGGLAEMMVARTADHVPLHDAVVRLNLAFEALPLTSRSWLEVLEGSDILRRDIEPNKNRGVWSRPNEVVRFSFQRLQDNLMAEHLVVLCREAGVEDAFDARGPLSFLARRYIDREQKYVGFTREWVGLAGAVWAAVAESFGMELCDLRSFVKEQGTAADILELRRVFHASIRERSATAFTPRTWQLLDELWDDMPSQKLAILLSTSCVPGHAWNARAFNKRLLALSPAERSAQWVQPFKGDGQSDLYTRAVAIAEWALTTQVEIADPEVVRLAGITLAWLRLVDNPEVQAVAARGLDRLQTVAPVLSSHLQDEFGAVADPHLQSGLLGAG
jgi:hypothetical protein